MKTCGSFVHVSNVLSIKDNNVHIFNVAFGKLFKTHFLCDSVTAEIFD